MPITPIKLEFSFSQIPLLAEQIASELRKTGLFDSVKTVISEPSYSSAQVICEEWRYKGDSFSNYFVIDAENEIFQINPVNFRLFSQLDRYVRPFVYSPTHELAEEIVQIRLGKWLPKIGDNACGYSSETGRSSSFLFEIESDFLEEKRPNNSVHYFPSKKQRDTFIEKQKEKEKVKPRPFSELEIKPIFKPESIFDFGRKEVAGYKLLFDGKEIYKDENGFLKVR